MDPISAVGLVESSLGLALQFGSAAKALNDVASRYKNARLAIKSLAQNLDILQLTWTQIGHWFEAYAKDGTMGDNESVKRVQGFLETGTLVMEALEEDMRPYDAENLNFTQRSKLIWNENTLQGHQIRIRDQALSMSLFLQAVRLPTQQARANLLRKSEDQFRKSDESAYSVDSIIPSQLSISTGRRHSLDSSSQGSIEYRPMSFENTLFMSRVYMRNSKNMMIKKIFRVGAQSKVGVRDITQQVPDWETIRNDLDADSLLHSSEEVSIEDNETIRSYNYHENGSRRPQEVNNSSVPAQNLAVELVQACERGDILRVTTVLAHGARIDEEIVTKKWRLLHFAARSGQGSMVRFLIDRGAQVDAKDRDGIQPVHLASESGSMAVLKALFQAGAAVDCSDERGFQPLHYASMTPNRFDVIKYLLREGADIEAKASNGYRPLSLACTSDTTNLCTLIELGAKMDYKDGSESALETAIKRDSKWALEVLLKHGADPNCQKDDGRTILHILVRTGYLADFESPNRVEICQSLLNNGADVELADNAGNRILHYLADSYSERLADTVLIEQLAKLVLDQGADVDTTNLNGLSPLYLAIRGGNRQLIRQLVTSGASRLMQTESALAWLQVMSLPEPQTPRYTVKIWHRYIEGEWKLPTPCVELSVDEHGLFTKPAMDAVCEALWLEKPKDQFGQMLLAPEMLLRLRTRGIYPSNPPLLL